MKNLLVLGISLILAFNVALAQSTTQTTTPQEVKAKPNPKAPIIKFEKTTHDYGTIPKNGDPYCQFEFKNVGKEPLVLSNVKASCGCTIPEWTKEPILPGKTGVIKVKYATDRVGAINKSITVSSNASNGDQVIKIIGNVLPEPASILPEKPINKSGMPVE